MGPTASLPFLTEVASTSSQNSATLPLKGGSARLSLKRAQRAVHGAAALPALCWGNKKTQTRSLGLFFLRPAFAAFFSEYLHHRVGALFEPHPRHRASRQDRRFSNPTFAKLRCDRAD